MKRLLIKQDDQKGQAITGGFPKLLPSLTTMKELYELLNLGPFSEAVFEDIKAHGASNIAETYKAELNKQLDAAGVKFPALRKQQFEGSLQPLHDFQRAVLALPDSVSVEYSAGAGRGHATYLLSYATYNDTAAEFLPFTEETKESMLEEQCRTYTETEAEYKIWISALELLVAYDNMRSAMKEIGAESGFIGLHGTLLIERIIQNREGELSVSRDLIGTVRSVVASQLAQQYRHEEKQRKHQEAKAKREEQHSKSFDITTPEGAAAWKGYNAQQERERKAELQRKGYLV